MSPFPSSRSTWFRWAAVAICLLSIQALEACRRESPGGQRLLGDAVSIDVLVEQRDLAPPPAMQGNRFLTGWRPWRGAGELLLIGGRPASRLELVNLSRRQRTLVLDLRSEADAAPLKVRASVGGESLGTFEAADTVAIPLPSSLPLGRVAIDLAVDGPGRLVVRAAGVRPASASGTVEVDDDSIVQTGDSCVEISLPVGPKTILVGAFEPPTGGHADQRFELSAEARDGTRLDGFRWSPGWRNRFGRGRFWLELGFATDGSEDPAAEGGFVRLHFRALGDGPTGRWRDLRLLGAPVPRLANRSGGASRVEPATVVTEPQAGGAVRPRVVVLYVFDALRADHVGHLGAVHSMTSVLDRLAAEGVTFRRHQSVAPNTLPSTKALFSGHTFRSRGGWDLSPELVTLAERFTAAGYRTGLFSGNVNVGPAFGMDRGFAHVAGQEVVGPYLEEAGGADFNDSAERVQAAALDWLAELDSTLPVFLYLHTLHPHNPYDPPPEIRSRFVAGIPSDIEASTDGLVAIKSKRLRLDGADRDRIKGLYAGGLAYNDAVLAGFVDRLREQFDHGEVVLIVTSDHGEELFDHGGVLHGYTLYEEMIRIPLIVWSPGLVRPGIVEVPTDTLDVHDMLRSLIDNGLPASGVAELPSDRIRFAAASSLKGGIFSASWGRWKVIAAPRVGHRWGMGEGLGRGFEPEYVFDLAGDPTESENLAGSRDPVVTWLRGRLFAWMEGGAELEPEAMQGGEMPEPDAETVRRLKALGYLE